MGSTIQTAVNTQNLPRDEAEEWERVLKDEQFLELPSALEGRCGPDEFRYELTIVDESWQHTAVFTDAQVTQEMQPVIRRLTNMARHSPGEGSSSGGILF